MKFVNYANLKPKTAASMPPNSLSILKKCADVAKGEKGCVDVSIAFGFFRLLLVYLYVLIL